ncbi:MAG: RHS repeat protein, partial [FCB group bacterium]|nr:RHS repeat protein [FCB group bacterium]
EYDGLGRLKKVTNKHSQVEFVFTKEGRLKEEILRMQNQGEESYAHEYSVKHSYDDANNQTIVTYPSGRELTFATDKLYRLSSVKTEEGNGIGAYTYDISGKLTEKKYLNNLSLTAESYDVANRLLKFRYRNIYAENIYKRELKWNKLDLKDYSVDGEKGETYIYDAANHLVWQHDEFTNFSYTMDIDANENLKSRTRAILDLKLDDGDSLPIDFEDYKEKDLNEIPLRNNKVSHTYNERHELDTKDSNDENEFEYDENGNLKKWKSKGHEYFYNWKNQLVKVITTVNKKTETIEYRYDPLGRRIEKRVTGADENTHVTLYVFSGFQVLEEYEYDEGQAEPERLTWRYMYGSGIDEILAMETDQNGDGTLEPYIPLQDTNGNVIAIAGGQARLIEKVRYAPFGPHEILYDKDPPRLQYIAMKDGEIHVRFSEPVDLGEGKSFS